jgi:hypothetical protein
VYAEIALALLGLLTALTGARWLRKSSLEADDGRALLGLVFCFVGAALVLIVMFGSVGF